MTIDQVQKLLLDGYITAEESDSLLYEYTIWDENTHTVLNNPAWHQPDLKTIKKIGITGSFGKTCTCEILYQYLRAKGKSCLLLCTNGIFINDRTVQKDFLATSFSKAMLLKLLNGLCGANSIDYVIIELAAELTTYFNNNLFIDYIQLDITGLTFFSQNLTAHFNNDTAFYQRCKDKVLGLAPIRFVPSTCTEFNYTDIFENVESFRNYNKSQLRNWSLAKAILQKLGEYTIPEEEIPNFYIRGRYEDFLNNKIIIDTCWSGIRHLCECYKPLNKKFRVIYVPIFWPDINQSIINYRRRQLPTLASCEHVYITDPKEITVEKDLDFYKDFLPEDHSNFEYIFGWENCVRKAINELQDDEILLIACRENFRAFRHILVDLLDKE